MRDIKRKAQSALMQNYGFIPTQKEIHIIEANREGQYILFSIGAFIYSWDGCTLDKAYREIEVNRIGNTPEEYESYIVSSYDDFRGFIDD